MSSYAFSTDLSLPYDDAVARVREALAEEGFGILTEIDVAATLKKKLDVDFERYVILGACNPPLAHRALQAEHDIGVLLPCNVVVHEKGSGSRVVFFDPEAGLGMAGNDDLLPLGKEVGDRLRRVAERLATRD